MALELVHLCGERIPFALERRNSAIGVRGCFRGGGCVRGGESLVRGVRLDGGVLRTVPGARQRRFGQVADQGQELRAQSFAAQLFSEARGLFSRTVFAQPIQMVFIALAGVIQRC